MHAIGRLDRHLLFPVLGWRGAFTRSSHISFGGFTMNKLRASPSRRLLLLGIVVRRCSGEVALLQSLVLFHPGRLLVMRSTR